ncbi:MAG: response regulator [Pseudomonadota bacterium]
MTTKILFVDDEINLLNALKRQFRKSYQVSVALSGAEGLKKIIDEGPFAVIVSDMQMPEMNGVQFLQAAQKLSPDTVRLMLTGNADQKTAVDAVNTGNIFSFYTKPCSIEVMTQAIEKAVVQYDLIIAERKLLEETLNGAVKLLMDMLSMIAPESFGRTTALQTMIKKLSDEGELVITWDLELAAMLSNVSCITLPPETLEKISKNITLNPDEKNMVFRLPEVGKNLISNIPRLEKVAEIVLYQNKYFNGKGFPNDDVTGDDIPKESRLLKILIDLEEHKEHGYTYVQSLKLMASNRGIYDPEILKYVAKTLSKNENSLVDVPFNTTLNGLQPGNVLASNVETIDGKLLFSAGHEVTSTVIERLINYNQITKIKEPIQIYFDASNNVITENFDRVT